MPGELIGNMLNFIRSSDQQDTDKRRTELAEVNMGLDFIQNQQKLEANKQNQAIAHNIDMAKYTLTKMTNLWESATGVEREQLVGEMKNYYNVLPSQLKPVLKPYLQTGPLSDLQMKSMDFEKAIGTRPVITTSFEEDRNLWAEQKFAQADYDSSKKEYLTKVKEPRKNMISLGEGNFIVRGNNNIPQVVTKEELQFEKWEKLTGKTMGEIIANNGVAEYDPIEVTQNGIKKQMIPGFDIGTGKPTRREVITDDTGKAKNYVETKTDMEIKDLYIALTTDNPAFSKYYPIYKEMLDDSKLSSPLTGEVMFKDRGNQVLTAVSDRLRKQYPGYQFTFIMPREKRSWWRSPVRWFTSENYYSSPKAEMYYIKADLKPMFDDNNKFLDWVYYNAAQDKVWNTESFNNPLGRVEDEDALVFKYSYDYEANPKQPMQPIGTWEDAKRIWTNKKYGNLTERDPKFRGSGKLYTEFSPEEEAAMDKKLKKEMGIEPKEETN